VPIYKEGDRRDCDNYRVVSLVNYMKNFVQRPVVRVNIIRRGN